VETTTIRLTKARLRGVLSVLYWAVAFVALTIFSSGDTFCARPGARNHTLATAQLAFALAGYDLLVSVVVASFAVLAKNLFRRQWILVLLTTLIVGAGFAYLPVWIYRGYGNFRFENTWADVNCFFTEGYGIAFPLIVAPVLAFVTLLREVVFERFSRTQPETSPSLRG
jgi:hypothetical protein